MFKASFPQPSARSGQGFSYSFGRALGAVFPALVGYLSATMSLGCAIAVFAVAAYALMISLRFAALPLKRKGIAESLRIGVNFVNIVYMKVTTA